MRGARTIKIYIYLHYLLISSSVNCITAILFQTSAIRCSNSVSSLPSFSRCLPAASSYSDIALGTLFQFIQSISTSLYFSWPYLDRKASASKANGNCLNNLPTGAFSGLNFIPSFLSILEKTSFIVPLKLIFSG